MNVFEHCEISLLRDCLPKKVSFDQFASNQGSPNTGSFELEGFLHEGIWVLVAPNNVMSIDNFVETKLRLIRKKDDRQDVGRH